MISLRLITTGLDDVHSVIGYELCHTDKPCEQVLIQPREGSKFSCEAMHDINGISIPDLRAKGEDRRESLKTLLDSIDSLPTLIWYKPFVNRFLNLIFIELAYDRNVCLIDVFALAKQKKFDPPSYKLKDVYEYTDTDNLFDLHDYLSGLPEPTRLKRI